MGVALGACRGGFGHNFRDTEREEEDEDG